MAMKRRSFLRFLLAAPFAPLAKPVEHCATEWSIVAGHRLIGFVPPVVFEEAVSHALIYGWAAAQFPKSAELKFVKLVAAQDIYPSWP